MRSWKSANYGKQEQHDERWWRVPRKIVGEREAQKLASISHMMADGPLTEIFWFEEF